jgi:hypothetical protein
LIKLFTLILPSSKRGKN